VAQSVELLLDEASDSLVRDQWARLAAAGLPSQARHLGASLERRTGQVGASPNG